MSTINQNSVLNSVREALIPGPTLIDGRTEEDWLRFLSDFAALINFYDQDNSVLGSWEPFLLKDPVFLMAVVSKTEYAKIYGLYLRTCHKLAQLLLPFSDPKDLPVSFNQLFDQLIRIFIRIKEWTAYMQRSAMEYPLKTYVTGQIRAIFANYLQAIFALRAAIFSTAIIPGVIPADPAVVAGFDLYELRIWKEGRRASPYWEVLGLSHPLQDNTASVIFKALTDVGAQLFNFLSIIIQQAGTAFRHLTKLKSSYPDTTLLRTFIHLLKVQQDQLNTIAGKHLSFYYKNILKQTERPAQADRAYIIAGLLKKDQTLSLPAGTLFDAGIDPLKNPVIFESTAAVVLNPAAIPAAYTLSRVPGADGLSTLQREMISNPGIVQKDPEGKILSWNTLGSRMPIPAAQTSLGIAFASPMLLLREGTRKITLTLGYTGTADLKMMQQASCFLSTLTVWYAVSADIRLADLSSGHALVISLSLKATDPPIERFLVNPDGVNSSWPMFKLVFRQVTAAAAVPPVVHSVQIDVAVSGMETFQLYNDYGALSTKVAYPPFGPSPLDGSNFIIGSNEVFSKPVKELTMQLNWSVLPPDFSVYYQSYNLYLNNQLRISKTADIPRWKRFFCKKKSPEPALPDEKSPYNNTCFTVDFQVMEAQSWKPLVFQTDAPVSAQTTDRAVSSGPNLLFIEDEAMLSSYSRYAATDIPPGACDPALQNQPLKFTEISTAGFLKMVLTGPEYGFGSGIYPNVVSAVTLYNSQILYNAKDIVFAAPAQLPFAPKLKSFSAAYSAAVYYVLADNRCVIEEHKYLLEEDKRVLDDEHVLAADKPDQGEKPDSNRQSPVDYPLQCFLYAPFGNYPVYDSQQQLPVKEDTIGSPSANRSSSGTPSAAETATAPFGIPLYAAFNYDGYLYLQVEDLIPASSLNLYFELTGKYNAARTGNSRTDFYYLSDKGWKALLVLADGTYNLTSPGIVSLRVPEDISNESSLMPGKSYWIVIVADDVSAVANTVLLSTNGMEVQRSGLLANEAVAIPALAGDAITKTKNPIPQISTVEQPFPSFGGRPAEDEKTMNQRVSTRLKTKDRVSTIMDYYSITLQEFSDIYTITSIYNIDNKTTNVYAVNAVSNCKEPNAFLPIVSSGRQEQVQIYLQQRSSAFAMIRVENPSFQTVMVLASVTILAGYEFAAIRQQIIHALNIYLSPWIKDSGMQAEIYQEITDVQVSAFIKTISGVATIERVSFKSWLYTGATADAEKNAAQQINVVPLQKTALFVSHMIHEISINPSVS